jgi:hypothetical protein
VPPKNSKDKLLDKWSFGPKAQTLGVRGAKTAFAEKH